MVNLSKFAERLDELMFYNNIRQSELAAKKELKAASVSRYLRGNCEPTLKALIALAEFFSCSADYLLGISEDNKRSEFLPCRPLGERFKEITESKGYTPYGFCKAANIHDNRFYDWLNEKHMPSLANVIKIARFFDCSVDYLLGRE